MVYTTSAIQSQTSPFWTSLLSKIIGKYNHYSNSIKHIGFGHETMVCTVCFTILYLGNVHGCCYDFDSSGLSDSYMCPKNRPSLVQMMAWPMIMNDDISLIVPLGATLSEILIQINTFPFKKMHLKMSSAKCQPLMFFKQTAMIWATGLNFLNCLVGNYPISSATILGGNTIVLQ